MHFSQKLNINKLVEQKNFLRWLTLGQMQPFSIYFLRKNAKSVNVVVLIYKSLSVVVKNNLEVGVGKNNNLVHDVQGIEIL